jgi:hypothetical protein
MKKTILIFIILLGISVSLISETALIESEYQSSYGNVLFLNNYRYHQSISPKWSFIHTGNLIQSRNKRFNRYSRNTDLGWYISRDEHPVSYKLHLDYIAALDKAEPDSEMYEIDKVRRQMGLELLINPLDSLAVHSGFTYIRSGESNSRYLDKTVSSNGYQSNNIIHYIQSFNSANLMINSYFNILRLDYDYLRSYGGITKFDIVDPVINTEFSYHQDLSKIYLLNDQVDTHIRSLYRASILHKNRLSDDLAFRIGNIYQARDNRLRESQDRNYLETDNLLFTSAILFWEPFRMSIDGEYRLFSRSFKEETSSRKQEQRGIKGSVSYIFSERDSLSYSHSVNLTRTDYTLKTNILDNDQRYEEQQISLYLYFRDGLRLINHFSFMSREEVYLKSDMSANNKNTRIYNLLPALNIALSRNLLFTQEYHLRADYDDFIYDDTIRDRMYRRFSAAYSLLSGLPWKSGHYRYTPERESFYSSFDFLLGVSYKYDTNSSGNRAGDAYEIFAENEYHTLQFELFRRVYALELGMRPRFIWSNIRYEFSHNFDISYYFPNRSNYVSFNINSSGSNKEDLLWRIKALVNIYF